jgi:hypothetical protein
MAGIDKRDVFKENDNRTRKNLYFGGIIMSEKSPLLKLTELLEENDFYIMSLDARSYNESVDGYATLGEIKIIICPKKPIKWLPISNWKNP